MICSKKKIGLLTLRVDNNYGNNLQRYALFTVLTRMGFDVTHIFLRSEWCNISRRRQFVTIVKNIIKKFLLHNDTCICPWKSESVEFLESRQHTEPFYNRYIKHSPLIYSRRKLLKYVHTHHFDAFIVGSDQVWRRRFTQRWGIDLFFLSFVHKNKVKKIAYGASFGLFDSDYLTDDVKKLTEFYRDLDAVSVREVSGLEILNRYNWVSPMGSVVLDPTFLLNINDYEHLIEAGTTIKSKGDMFCYLLDVDKHIKDYVLYLAEELHLTPFWASIGGKDRMSIEQWLRSFQEAKMVVTNSYHGVVFSLIFNKPFKLLLNEERGNARFHSLKVLFELSDDCTKLDWQKINSIKNKLREKSLEFLRDSLN